jgi:hypothetical protein
LIFFVFVFLYRYLSATSVSDRDNITWAGQVNKKTNSLLFNSINDSFQTLGNDFTVDGRFRGTLNVTTINCVNNVCTIPVPSPGFALVFLAPSPKLDPFISMSRATKTFATTAYSRAKNTARVAPGVLATSNGHSGVDRENLGSTSSDVKNIILLGDAKGGVRSTRVGVLVGLVVGGIVSGRALFFFGQY